MREVGWRAAVPLVVAAMLGCPSPSPETLDGPRADGPRDAPAGDAWAADAPAADARAVDAGGADGLPDACQPACEARSCGDDGCGGACGACQDDGLACTEAQCLEGACVTSTKTWWCLIAGECVSTGTANPANPCERCDWTSPLAWSEVVDGFPCEGDGACLDGACCHPDCTGRVCGDDGCGGSCGDCAVVCAAGDGPELTVGTYGFTDYVIDGVNDPELTLIRGCEYAFHVDAPGHPFWIKTVSGAGLANTYDEGVVNNGTQAGTLVWLVSFAAPATLYYNCQFHATTEGPIHVIDAP